MPLPILLFICVFCCCTNSNNQQPIASAIENVPATVNPYSTISAIPVPAGYSRVQTANGSYAEWLQQLPLKKNKTVYLYNGYPKSNQAAQYAVIDISTGNKDLQQCADAVMRLRAEYLYGKRNYTAIDFTDNDHTHYRLPAGANRDFFNQYLEKVFSYCGTASLEKQMQAVPDFTLIEAGDVLIKGGSPGHAMQVMDIAINRQGKKIFLLAQSYMPAQDMHVVINPANKGISPWYEADDQAIIATPEWIFRKPCLKKWPAD